jgi:hypothetical protein
MGNAHEADFVILICGCNYISLLTSTHESWVISDWVLYHADKIGLLPCRELSSSESLCGYGCQRHTHWYAKVRQRWVQAFCCAHIIFKKGVGCAPISLCGNLTLGTPKSEKEY